MTEQEFLAKESRILGEIEEAGIRARETGLVSKVPEKGLEERGYIISLGYRPGSCMRMDEFCSHLRNAFPEQEGENGDNSVMCYGPKLDNVHTTVAIHKKRRVESSVKDVDTEVIKGLSELVGEYVFEQFKKSRADRIGIVPRINFDRFIHDESTVIARPMNHRGFYPLIEELVGRASKAGIALAPSWGSYLTVARFKRNISPGEMEAFNDLMRIKGKTFESDGPKWDYVPGGIDYGIPKPEVTSLNVGTYKFAHNGFYLNPVVSFDLNFGIFGDI